MMSKEEHIKYWLDSAQSDWESVSLLYDGSKFSQSLFFVHLSIEKICKALFLKYTEETYPPRIHDIVKLLKKSDITLPDEDMAFLKALNVYNLEGRYPDYLSKIQTSTTKKRAEEIIETAERIRKCLLKKMQ